MQDFKTSVPLLLIPAAGFGRRMGSPEAKEMLPGPDGRPLIQWGLEQAFLRGWQVHVVSRKGKRVLAEFLKSQARPELSWNEIDSSLECADTLLQSELSWRERVIVLLPDTRFEPTEILDQMAASLLDHDLVYATFPVKDPSTWGVIQQSKDGWQIAEKCAQTGAGAEHQAWGLLGFQKHTGKKALEAHLRSILGAGPQNLPTVPGFCALKSFQDLTRTEPPASAL